MVKLLVDHGADVNAQTGDYSTALQAESEGGHVEVVNLLQNASIVKYCLGRWLGKYRYIAHHGVRSTFRSFVKWRRLG